MARKKKKTNTKPNVNPELEGFDIKIDTFGEIQSSFNIDKINSFLNKHVEDKKLKDRNDLPKDNGEEDGDLKERD